MNQIDAPAEDNTWHDAINVEDLKSQARDKYQQNKPFGRNDLRDASSDAQMVDGNAAAANLKERVPEDHKQRVRDTWGKSKNYMDQKMPKDRRDQTIWRLKKMVVEIQGHQDCKFHTSIDTRLRLADEPLQTSAQLTRFSVSQRHIKAMLVT